MTAPTPTGPGWYDDPDDPEQLRYFDGILWTANVTPRRTPSRAPSATPGTAPATVHPTAPVVGPPASTHPPAPPAPAPHATAYPVGVTKPTTPDGVPIASYGMRVAAYLIDMIITGFLGLLVGGWFLWQAIEPMWIAMQEAVASGNPESVDGAVALLDVRAMGIYSGIALIVSLVYQLFCLTRWSATPGKLLCSLSVRRVEHPGVLDFSAASRRVGFTVALSALGNLPLVGFFAVVMTVVDLIWPLTDKRRQALHDKVADTVVVVGRQQKATAANTVR
jgi:uncharacterized RDD family membrane protein YckC